MAFARSLVFVVWLYGTMAFSGIVGAPWTLFSRKGSLFAMRIWAPLTIFGLRWICGVRVKIEGREHIPMGRAIVAMKHQAMFDTLMPGLLLSDPCIIYKAELSRAPMFG